MENGIPDDSNILYSEAEIEAFIDRNADLIRANYSGRLGRAMPLVLLVVLKGGANYAMALGRRLVGLPIVFEYVRVRTFDETMGVRTSRPQVDLDINTALSLKEKHVLVVDDIYDFGTTMQLVRRVVEQMGATSVAATCLLYNAHNSLSDRSKPFKPTGLEFPSLPINNQFVYGYGLDRARGLCRNLPNIYKLGEGEDP